MNETITPSLDKNYLQTGAEPFFIADKDGNAHILRPADHNPIKETN